MERKDVVVSLGTAEAVAGAGPPTCETCGSTDRVSFYGMDGTPLCWKHMLEANAKEDAWRKAAPERD